MATIACIGVEFLEPTDHPGAQARIWFLDATGQAVRPCRLVLAPIAKLRGHQLQRFFWRRMLALDSLSARADGQLESARRLASPIALTTTAGAQTDERPHLRLPQNASGASRPVSPPGHELHAKSSTARPVNGWGWRWVPHGGLLLGSARIVRGFA